MGGMLPGSRDVDPYGPRYVTCAVLARLSTKMLGTQSEHDNTEKAFSASRAPGQATNRPAYAEPLFRGACPRTLVAWEEEAGGVREGERMGLRNLGIEHLLETRTIAQFYYYSSDAVRRMHCQIYYIPRCLSSFLSSV